MTSKPEQDEERTPTIGPNTRVTFFGATLLAFLGGLIVCSATIAVMLERMSRDFQDRPTRVELYYWSVDAQRSVPGFPVFPPTKKD